MTLRFGTDGVRAEALTELTIDFVERLGHAAASVLGPGPWLIGRDTRESGPALEAALAVGLTSVGADVELLGIVPTPAVAALGAFHDRPGAMISASHNVWSDNGVKLFGSGGQKLDDSTQAQVEVMLVDQATGVDEPGPTVAGTVAQASADALVAYEAHIMSSIDGRDLEGLRVVVDCSNGASSNVAPEVLTDLGADVIAVANEPNGRNINEGCGSTHLAFVAAAVAEHAADLGIAFDGDADRVLAVDGDGELVDGDQIIAMLAIDRQARSMLRDESVVVTVMTNLGFRQAMTARGIRVVETPVGDRHVLEALDAHDLDLGGEQSGHIIFRRLATTGDGLLTAVQLLDLVRRAGRPLEELAAEAMTRLPQVLVNVRLDGRPNDLVARLAGIESDVEHELGDRGRVLIRPSGTEPLVRVMVEAPTADLAQEAADRLVDRVRTRIAD